MDFARNLEDLKSFLDARQYRWALIGGVALADLADIRHLALLPGVDHDEIRSQFERHGLLDRYRELERFL
jgi:hypothetical protein